MSINIKFTNSFNFISPKFYSLTASNRRDALHYPIKVQDRVYGTVIIEGSEPLEAFENSVLLSILGECALALENSRNTAEKEEAKLQAESEKLRATLLRSISHDLRTPLTAISGNASILLSDSENLDSNVRKQMYGDIYDDSAWLHNLVENLLAVTKIEEGRMELKTQPQLAEEIVSEALQHISRKRLPERAMPGEEGRKSKVRERECAN